MNSEQFRNLAGELGLSPGILGLIAGMKGEEVKEFEEGRMPQERRNIYEVVMMRRFFSIAKYWLNETRGGSRDITLHEDGGIEINHTIDAIKG